MVITAIFIIFSYLFFSKSQYVISLLSLVLAMLMFRIEDLEKLKVNKEGIDFALRTKEDDYINNTLKENIPLKEKIENTQKLIDEVFKLGYIAGGGNTFTNIFNVKIIRNEKGNITGYQYDEN